MQRATLYCVTRAVLHAGPRKRNRTVAKMNSGLGGPDGYGEGVFTTSTLTAGNVDDGSVYVDVSAVFGDAGLNLYGANYSGLYVNSNGLISFDGPNTAYSGNGLEDLNGPAIAPFWADHNLNNGGEIYWDVDPDAGTVTVTWKDVAPYSGTGTNSYQVVLSNTGDGNFDVEYVYEKVQWTAGDNNQAIAGITDGGSNSYALDGSGEAAGLQQLDKHGSSNHDDKGTFELSVVNGEPDPRDGAVDGGGGNDNFVLDVLDKAGDAITTGADRVLAGGGNDRVDGNDGNDTVHGGEGSDTLLGGKGDDELYGDGLEGAVTSTTLTSITQSNFASTAAGYTVTATNIVDGVRSAASTSNVTAAMGGFGAAGFVSDSDSGINQQTGFDKASGLSEELSVAFDTAIDEVSFSFQSLYSASYGEQAQWTLFNDGVQVAQNTFTEIGSGSGNGTINLAGYGDFDQIVFTGLMQTDGTDGSDFFITEVRYATPVLAAVYNDSIEGGDGTDKIFGGLGADTIGGGTGADTIFGEDGNDLIDAGDDDDQVQGGEGDDTITGGLGADTLSGGLGDDLIDGGEGDDLLTTGLGQDTLLGGAGDDTLKNSAGDDSLVGGTGDDSIVATIGDDTLEGGDGQDTLIGGIDNDSLDGGAGDDSLTGDFEAGGLTEPGQKFAYEYYELDSVGTLNTLADAGFAGGQDNDNPPDGQGVIDDFDVLAIDAQHGGNTDSFAVKLVTTLTVTTAGTYFFDITSDDGAQVYVNGALVTDNDGVHGPVAASGSTALGAGEHLVEIVYFDQTGGETLSATLKGPDTGDVSIPLQNAAVATSFDDTIDGGSGSDTIEGGLGADSMTGGDDADTFIITDAFGNDTIVGGEGGVDDDTIDLSGLSGPVTVTFTDEEDGTITDGTDTITFSEIENLILTDQADSVDASITHDGLFGDAPGVDIQAGEGNDTIIGGRGGDTVDGGGGADSIDLGYGDDSAQGGTGADTLVGGSGNDTLEGGADADSLDGGIEGDTLIGGAGDDTLDGGEGGDVLTGGTGDDTFLYTPGDGDDTITDFNTGNTGTLDDGDSSNNDSIDLSGYYDHISELYADQADDGTLNQSNTTDTRGRSVDYSDNTQFGSGSLRMQGASADESSFTAENTGVVCFTARTMIRTPQGEVPVEALRPGDLVSTLDHGPQPLRWISHTAISAAALARNPKLRPIRLQCGVLGATQDLLVSPQHGILLDPAHLARATHLARGARGITRVDDLTEVTYYHLMFDRHEIIFGAGVASESFYPGPMALRALSQGAKLSMIAAFAGPDFDTTAAALAREYGPTARPFLKAKEVAARIPTGGIGHAGPLLAAE